MTTSVAVEFSTGRGRGDRVETAAQRHQPLSERAAREVVSTGVEKRVETLDFPANKWNFDSSAGGWLVVERPF